ncbi:MAG: T9SS type A sorting domain-containing protein [Chitinophagaceae bacterium]|nr:T9SS type A sorting domain-containing protein [Chitinophagaceae bacterium]
MLFTVGGLKAQYTFSYTYQNITRNNGGGTLEKGDTIEIRALMKVDKQATNVYYRDTIPSGLKLIPNSMKIVTNEGLKYKGEYTDAGGDDVAMTILSGSDKVMKINLGKGASIVDFLNFGTASGGGTIDPGDKPKFYGTTLFVVAYRLEVTADFEETINPGGKFYYTYKNNKNKDVSAQYGFRYGDILVTPNTGLCQNYASASFTAESSFGSGIIQNRAAGANVPGYLKVNMSINLPNDGKYAIANNTSADGTTDNTGPYRPNPNPHRVFNGYWDIIGDHTGAADPELGNPAVAPGTTGGYMLVVNAAYPTGEAYNDVISGLCPNTYYEFSAWVRNICGYCGIDSNSVSTNKPGVLPNLAFTINDVDYYTTGEIPWDGKWVKRGFIYKTGPTETSFKITIKNNAAGGGGNDWVLDDISLATCYPNLIMNPSDVASVCKGSTFYLSDTIRSYFDNYIYYCWEKSTDGGTTWASTGNCGIGTPVLKNGLWEYVVDTAFTAQLSDNGTYFRVKVATTYDNLSQAECSVDNSQMVLLEVFEKDCVVQANEVKDFVAKLDNSRARLSWTTLSEGDLKKIEVQKSTDGMNFFTIATLNPRHPQGGSYQFIENEDLTNIAFYRLKLIKKDLDAATVSEALSLRNYMGVLNLKVVNPFQNNIKIDFTAPMEGTAELILMDNYGRVVKKTDKQIRNGVSTLLWEGVSDLQPGVYILSVQINDRKYRQKILKNY